MKRVVLMSKLRNINGENLTRYEFKILGMLKISLRIVTFLLIVATIVMILRSIYSIFLVHMFSSEIITVINEILFTIILVELFTILYAYLKKGYIKVERVIEVGIIAVIRELLFNLFSVEPARLYALSALLFVLGILFFIEKYFSKERNV